MAVTKKEIFLKFKANRESFGSLSIDYELLESVYSYIIKADAYQLAHIYSSVNIEDLYVLTEFIKNKTDLKNEHDYSLTELLNRVENANKRIRNIEFLSKVLFGYVTLNEVSSKYERRQDLILESIKSISLLNYRNWGICLYLNIQNNELIEKLSELSFASYINTITSDTNKGLAYGRNRILDYAKNNYFDYVMFLDDDTYMIDKYLIEKLLYCEKLRSTFAFVGPEIVYKKSKVRKHGLQFFVGSIIDKNDYESFEEVDYIEGSCHMINVKKIGKDTLIGQYPEDYNCYFEETLPAFRAWYCAKMQNAVVKGARIVHIVDGGGFLSISSIKMFVRNYIFFIKDISKFYPMPNYKKVIYYLKFFKYIYKNIPNHTLKYYLILFKAFYDGFFSCDYKRRQSYTA